MFFNSSFFRLSCSLCLVFLLSVAVFADTVRFKDGTFIKGKVINFSGGSFTVLVGEGSRQRQMSYNIADIDSIQFDSTPVNAALQTSIQNTGKAPVAGNSTPENRVITVGQNNRTSTTPPVGSPAPVLKDTTPQPKPVQNTNVPETTAAVKTTPVVSSAPANNSAPAVNSTGANLKPVQLNVKVLADNTANGWTNSGWVVKKGQKIRITAGGRVSLGSGRFTTPSGISTLPDEGKLMPNVPTGALVVVIGDDNNDFLYIGAEREFVASRDGSLFLGVNEGNLNDNSGAFDVKIEIDANSAK